MQRSAACPILRRWDWIFGGQRLDGAAEARSEGSRSKLWQALAGGSGRFGGQPQSILSQSNLYRHLRSLEL